MRKLPFLTYFIYLVDSFIIVDIISSCEPKGRKGKSIISVFSQMEHSLKAHAIMACMSSEEGCSLCASRSLVSLSRHHAGTWLLLTDYMIRLCAAGLVRALSRNACVGAFFHPIHCGFCHRIVSSTNYSSIYFKTLISPH